MPESAPEAGDAYPLLPLLFQISHHRPRPHHTLFLSESRTNLEAYSMQGDKGRAHCNVCSAPTAATCPRALPDRPTHPLHARARAPGPRQSLQPSARFRLLPSNARRDTQAPPPPTHLPEVAGPEREQGTARSLAVLRGSLPAAGPGWERASGRGLHTDERGAERDLVTMAGPLALQLEQLLNPRPREADPEADPEEGEA